MSYFIRITLLFTLSAFTILASAQTADPISYEERMEWFKEAKLGIFIHWGLYSEGSHSESWSLYHQQANWEEYMINKPKVFTASKYDPQAWTALFKKVGADYVVMTAKHHDGFALWDTRLSDINAKDWSAARRDVYTPYVEAVRAAGLKVGVYYSLCDWSHPDYQPITFPRPEARLKKLYPQSKNEKYWQPWQRFQKFNFGQLNELFTNYQPDLIWFDGDWEHHADEWPSRVIKDSLLSWNPKVVVNSRLNQYGDYNTPEQDPPIATPDRPWELCLTLNENWGYRKDDTNYKPAKFLIETFIRCVSKGGNLLLDIGPLADGSIDPKQVALLETIGSWYAANDEAIRDTNPGLPYGHFDGETTLSKDSKTIYLFHFGKLNELTTLRGIKGKVNSISRLDNEQPISYKIQDSTPWNDIPGVIVMDLTEVEDAPFVTVLKVDFEEPISLYRGSGHGVELND